MGLLLTNASTEELAKLGFIVFVGSRDEARGKKAIEEIVANSSALKGKLFPVQLEVTEPASIAKAVEKVTTQFGRHVLCGGSAFLSALCFWSSAVTVSAYS